MVDKIRIVYAGTPDFSVPALRALLAAAEYDVVAVYTQPDRPAGRGQGVSASPVKLEAQASGIEVFQPENFSLPETRQVLADLQPDLMVVTAYGLLLPEAVLTTPRLGCINIHASLLPRWRGAAPIQRAILAGDDKTGITIMQMDKGLDTGNMLASADCDILPEDTGSSLHDRLMQLGATTLMQVMPSLVQQTVQAVQQDESQVTYAHKLSKAEARIDWQSSSEKIARMVRAFNAWPVAFTEFAKKTKKGMGMQSLRIWQSQVVNISTQAEPGTVIAESAEGIDVATGEGGVLRLLEIQPQGKRRMKSVDFLNANSLLNQLLGQTSAQSHE